ncbi:MAG: hypothetical protein JZD41_06935 [Thermoproteus sp.]|nr:hypothetical protein [Thermoproteus sp.]
MYNLDKIYNLGVCPYEYLQSLGRQSKISILPISYLESQHFAASIADVLNEAEAVFVDEAHNLLLHDLIADRDIPASVYCDSKMGKCVLLPFVAEMLKRRTSCWRAHR